MFVFIFISDFCPIFVFSKSDFAVGHMTYLHIKFVNQLAHRVCKST